MFRPFLYPNNHGRRQQYNNNNNRSTNSQTAENVTAQLNINSEFHPVGNFYNSKQDDLQSSPADYVPVVNGTEINLTDPVIAEFLKNNPKRGFLKMKVSTNRGAVPIYSAVITISKADEDQKYTIAVEKTDVDGLTIPISLPAPDKTQSFNPQNPRPYASYDILVEHPQYSTVELKNIPVFDGITSVQQVNLLARINVPAQTAPEQTPPEQTNQGGTTSPKE